MTNKTISMTRPKIPKDSRHIRWNYEKSEENDGFVRYFFVIVDDKGRRAILNKALEHLCKYNSGVERIRESEGKVNGSEFRYLFSIYDSRTAPNFINWKEIGKRVVHDKNLYERKIGKVEDYVQKFYGD